MLRRCFASFGPDDRVIREAWSHWVRNPKIAMKEAELFPYGSGGKRWRAIRKQDDPSESAPRSHDVCCADAASFAMYQSTLFDGWSAGRWTAASGAVFWNAASGGFAKSGRVVRTIRNYEAFADQDAWLPGDVVTYLPYSSYRDSRPTWYASHVNVYLGPMALLDASGEPTGQVFHFFDGSLGLSDGGDLHIKPLSFRRQHWRFRRWGDLERKKKFDLVVQSRSTALEEAYDATMRFPVCAKAAISDGMWTDRVGPRTAALVTHPGAPFPLGVNRAWNDTVRFEPKRIEPEIRSMAVGRVVAARLRGTAPFVIVEHRYDAEAGRVVHPRRWGSKTSAKRFFTLTVDVAPVDLRGIAKKTRPAAELVGPKSGVWLPRWLRTHLKVPSTELLRSPTDGPPANAPLPVPSSGPLVEQGTTEVLLISGADGREVAVEVDTAVAVNVVPRSFSRLKHLASKWVPAPRYPEGRPMRLPPATSFGPYSHGILRLPAFDGSLAASTAVRGLDKLDAKPVLERLAPGEFQWELDGPLTCRVRPSWVKKLGSSVKPGQALYSLRSKRKLVFLWARGILKKQTTVEFRRVPKGATFLGRVVDKKVELIAPGFIDAHTSAPTWNQTRPKFASRDAVAKRIASGDTRLYLAELGRGWSLAEDGWIEGADDLVLHAASWRDGAPRPATAPDPVLDIRTGSTVKIRRGQKVRAFPVAISQAKVGKRVREFALIEVAPAVARSKLTEAKAMHAAFAKRLKEAADADVLQFATEKGPVVERHAIGRVGKIAPGVSLFASEDVFGFLAGDSNWKALELESVGDLLDPKTAKALGKAIDAALPLPPNSKRTAAAALTTPRVGTSPKDDPWLAYASESDRRLSRLVGVHPSAFAIDWEAELKAAKGKGVSRPPADPAVLKAYRILDAVTLEGIDPAAAVHVYHPLRAAERCSTGYAFDLGEAVDLKLSLGTNVVSAKDGKTILVPPLDAVTPRKQAISASLGGYVQGDLSVQLPRKLGATLPIRVRPVSPLSHPVRAAREPEVLFPVVNRGVVEDGTIHLLDDGGAMGESPYVTANVSLYLDLPFRVAMTLEAELKDAKGLGFGTSPVLRGLPASAVSASVPSDTLRRWTVAAEKDPLYRFEQQVELELEVARTGPLPAPTQPKAYSGATVSEGSLVVRAKWAGGEYERTFTVGHRHLALKDKGRDVSQLQRLMSQTLDVAARTQRPVYREPNGKSWDPKSSAYERRICIDGIYGKALQKAFWSLVRQHHAELVGKPIWKRGKKGDVQSKITASKKSLSGNALLDRWWIRWVASKYTVYPAVTFDRVEDPKGWASHVDGVASKTRLRSLLPDGSRDTVRLHLRVEPQGTTIESLTVHWTGDFTVDGAAEGARSIEVPVESLSLGLVSLDLPKRRAKRQAVWVTAGKVELLRVGIGGTTAWSVTPKHERRDAAAVQLALRMLTRTGPGKDQGKPFYAGTVDGKFGRVSNKALKAWAKDRGLTSRRRPKVSREDIATLLREAF